jgi:NitT/TauT family transport system substrate-binding protein
MRAIGLTYRRISAIAMLGLLLAVACGPTGSSAPAAPSGASQAGGSQSAPAAPPARVRMAYASIAGSMLPAWIAKDEGIFQKYNLDVEMMYIAGQAKSAEAMVAREIDFAIGPATLAMGPGLEGADLVMVMAWSAKSAFAVYSQPSIQSVADLRGKRIGVSRRGSATEIWAATVLDKYGLKPDRDYAFLAMGGQPEQLAGLQNGAVDAAVLGVPTNLQARKLGMRELMSYRDHGLDFAFGGAVTSQRFLREQPDVSERVVKALAEGVAVMMQDDERAIAVLGRNTQVEDREMLEESLTFERSRADRDMLPTPSGLRAAMEELAENNPKAATANALEFADTTILQRLHDSGFVKGLYAQ